MNNSVPLRCIAINKNNKKCRTKIQDNQFFCCENHYPINKDIILNECFICNEKITNSKEILYLKCKHAFHKPCYVEWLEYSTYNNPICLICRTDIFKKPNEFRKNKFINKSINIDKLIKISELIKINKNNKISITDKNNDININNISSMSDFMISYLEEKIENNK